MGALETSIFRVLEPSIKNLLPALRKGAGKIRAAALMTVSVQAQVLVRRNSSSVIASEISYLKFP